MASSFIQDIMKSSPVYTKYETPDYIGYEFDPQLDFALFLKEARTQACNQSFEEAPPNSDEPRKKQEDEVQKNEKKSWRRSLFSWLKAEKRSKPNTMERSKSNNNNSSHNKSKPIRSGYVSGPIIDQSGGGSASASGTSRSRRPMSGSLNGLFNSTKKMMEDNNVDHTNRIPYTSLESMNNPPTLQSYGPIYMVT